MHASLATLNYTTFYLSFYDTTLGHNLLYELQ